MASTGFDARNGGYGTRLRRVVRRASRLLAGETRTSGEAATSSPRSGAFIALDRSALARKIILFNLIAMLTLVGGVLLLNPTRDSLVQQRERGLVSEARLLAAVIGTDPTRFVPSGAHAALEGIPMPNDVTVHLFDGWDRLLAETRGAVGFEGVTGIESLTPRTTILSNALAGTWEVASRWLSPDPPDAPPLRTMAKLLAQAAAPGETVVRGARSAEGFAFTVVVPVRDGTGSPGSVAVSTGAGEIDRLVRAEREQLLQMMMVALMVSIGLSIVLASTIANPLADLAAAAEAGRARKRSGRTAAPRVRIPDLSARPDEIGRLSAALRGMVSALYDRIDANEQFAADVAHEIKNPLASLRSAVGTMSFAKTDEQRGRLLAVIEHDVRRLDRLVSDISNASRLDRELVRDEEEPFDLVAMVRNIADHHGREAAERGVDVITDLPDCPVIRTGLEDRLAQVLVNLVTNAISFCEHGDAVRVWIRERNGRALVVVEDTGPGIPDSALGRVFERFYSERPEREFGNHSGLGLAISRQIVEAHGGVIWAENIRPTEADPASDPLGARFVVGLPL